MRVVVLVLLAACGRLDFDAAVPRDAQPDAADVGLVAWLRMEDDPTDGDLVDSVGGRTAICAPGLTCGTSTAGHIGQALLLDGTQQFYRLFSDPALVTPAAFTVTLWVRSDRMGMQGNVVTKRYSTIYNSWGIYLDRFANWVYESPQPQPGSYDVIGPAQLSVWTHLAISWDDATKHGYINGVRMLDATPPDVSFDDRELLIGCDDDDGTGRFGYFQGAIDELRIYDRVLTDAEVQQLAAE